MGSVFRVEPTVLQLVKEFPTLCGTLEFITVFTTACQINPVHALPPCSFTVIFNIIIVPKPKPPQSYL
jgi:hypothetical protein